MNVKTAQQMVDLSAGAEDGHFEQKIGIATVECTDFGQRFILNHTAEVSFDFVVEMVEHHFAHASQGAL